VGVTTENELGERFAIHVVVGDVVESMMISAI
jgi:hypothetical protein